MTDQERTALVLTDVFHERKRQEELRAAGRFEYTCASVPGMADTQKLAVLVEEVGEVARALLEKGDLANDKHGVELRKELVQVAAVCVAWCEAMPRSPDELIAFLERVPVAPVEKGLDCEFCRNHLPHTHILVSKCEWCGAGPLPEGKRWCSGIGKGSCWESALIEGDTKKRIRALNEDT